MIPVKNVRRIAFANAEVGDLLYSANEDWSRFLVVSAGGARFALFLETKYRGLALPLVVGQPRTGFAVSGAKITVDPSSAVHESYPLGSIVLTKNGAAMRARVGEGYPQRLWVSLYETAADEQVHPDDVAFVSWRIVLADGCRDIELFN